MSGKDLPIDEWIRLGRCRTWPSNLEGKKTTPQAPLKASLVENALNIQDCPGW